MEEKLLPARLHLSQAVVVEGKYDKIKLESVIRAVIIPTNGYGIFKDAEKLALIRYYAETTCIIILTDSDSAGFRIRNYLKGAISQNQIKHVYIPDVFGKERRKRLPSAEGKLGVEGISRDMLLEAFARAGVTASETEPEDPITRLDFYELGLMGGQDSAASRRALLQKLSLPSLLSTTGMLEVLNARMTRTAFYAMLAETPDTQA